MILITGATGNLGRHLIPRLQAAGLPFRVLQHRSAIPGVEGMQADASRPETLGPAFAGVDRLFLLSPYTLELPANEANLIAAAKAAGVGHIVKLSAIGADPAAASTVLSGHGESEANLRASGVPFTIVRVDSFMQNIPAFFGEAIKAGQGIAVAAGEGAVGWIDLADLADAVVALLSGPPRGGVVTLTGPQALSYRDVADLIAAQTGKAVPYTAQTEAQSRDGMIAAGFPDWMADGFARYFSFQAEGRSAVLTDELAGLIGRAPSRLQDYLRQEQAALV